MINSKKKLDFDFFRILILRTIGNFLILSSLFIIGKTFYQPAYQEIKYFLDKTINKKYLISNNKIKPQTKTVSSGILSSLLNVKDAEVLSPIDPNFSIIITKIGANAKVISNVDPANETEYLNALKTGVAHALGTAFPGEGGHVFLFAHSTDYFWNVGNYNAIFYLLYKLENNDQIDIFYKGKRISYKVVDKKIVSPEEVEYLTKKTNFESLTLQTCWPLGTTLKRLLVFAERLSN